MAHVQTSASVQTTGASSLSPSLTGVTAGNALVYGVSMWHSTAPASTPPTNYTEAIESSANNRIKVSQGYLLSAPSGTNTPAIGLAASSWGRAYLLEYSGLTTHEAQNSATGNNTAPGSGDITVSATTCTLIGVASTTIQDSNIAPGSGWTQRAVHEDQDAGQAIHIEERTGVSGTQAAAWTMLSGPWCGCVVSYPAASAAPVLPPRQVLSYQAAHRAATI